MPATSQQTAGFKAGRDRSLRWVSTAIAALAAAVAILVVAMVAVVLGIS
jgi:hypothetical protein